MPSSSPSQNKLVLYFIILLGLAGGYMYHTQFVIPFEVQPPTVAQAGKDTLVQFKDFTLKTEIFSNVAYTALQIFGEQPVSPGNPGRSSLFPQ